MRLPLRTLGAPLRHPRNKRYGAILILAAVLMVPMMAMLAFSIDAGYILVAQTDLQRAVDAGALAGAGTIAEGTDAADSAVRRFIMANSVAGQDVRNEDIEVETGHWDDERGVFVPATVLPSAIRARATARNLPYFFGRVFGHDRFDLTGEAIAMYMPREIMLVLDYSGSMCYDSQFRGIGKLGKDEVVANLKKMWQELGSPQYGNMQFEPTYINDDVNDVLKKLELDKESYPYPSGSWKDYVKYVQRSSLVRDAGYRNEFGYLTWIQYLQDVQPAWRQTPDLWKTSQQPITAVKDAVTLFLAYLQEVETDDRLGLAVYTAANDNNAVVESGLTRDMQSVEDVSRHRQAGHYNGCTNISAGLKDARQELDEEARIGAFKMIVLMTDGIANRPYSVTAARQQLLRQADMCAASGYPVCTISLGSGADTELMQDVADRTGGIHFNVPGGRNVEDYEDQLKDAFRQIADHRPLKIVK